MNVAAWLTRISRELKIFAVASLVMGIGYSIVDSTFNNFLNERFSLTGFQRSFLEVPRELPGVLVVFVSAMLCFLCSRRLGAVSLALVTVGAIAIGFLSPTYAFMMVWLFIYSTGQHLFMPVASTIGMELAKDGKTGQRLGQLNAIRNGASILGSFVVFVGFKYLGFTFKTTFVIAAVALAVASLLMFTMKKDKPRPASMFLKMHKEYKLYYILATLSGARKQIFITFAPWVLVTIFKQPTQILATLMMAGGIIGIIFQPLLGWMVDRFGEKMVLATEAVLLVFVCFGYGFSKFVFPEATAFLVVCACYLFDQMLMSVGMARSTYMKKIALQPDHVQPALTMSISIDHVFSVAAALIGGVIWNYFGFQYVFLMGTVIAAANLLTVLKIKIPKPEMSKPS